MNIVKTIERFIPIKMLNLYRKTKWQIKKRIYSHRYQRAIERLSLKKDPINVVFFVIEATNWKYDYLYHLFEQDTQFNVSVLVCEKMDVKDDKLRMEILHRCIAMCKQHGYNVFASYNEDSGEVFNPQLLHPDIIFYCNPYGGFFRKGYYMNKFRQSLICYANYSYEIIPFSWAFSGPMQNLAWRYFCESKGHQDLVKHFSPFKGWNTKVTGYPVFDAFMKNKAEGKEWKIVDRRVKRIIWAPHQSIYDAKMSNNAAVVQFSTFLLYADFMLEMAEKYREQIQIAFKPHPFLKQNLYSHSDWGREKTDNYYNTWANGENTCFVDSDYVDLFCTSDALIHDCGSFTAEYLCTKKPCMYLSTYMDDSNMNMMGQEAFRSHYHGKSKIDIEQFILEVVLNEHDSMEEQRITYFNKNLLPPNNCSVAENIINEIKKELHK